jgi:glycosyltransferase involved in cell wall biosynthesis
LRVINIIKKVKEEVFMDDNFKNEISAILCVFNEEMRIRNILENLLWCDDIIIVDKSSTDRTVEVANNYNCRIISCPYSDTGDEFKFGIDVSKHDWILILTASDLLGSKLPRKLNNVIRDTKFDAVSIPVKFYTFGISNRKHSPWCADRKILLSKKTNINTSKTVHKEILINTHNIYLLRDNGKDYIHHLTHPNLNLFLERHIRYAKLEANDYIEAGESLYTILWRIIKSFFFTILKKKTWLLGRKGLLLILGYTLYPILILMYYIEKKYFNTLVEYESITNKINSGIM